MPSLHFLLIVPVVILAAALNRHRGGWIGTGHTQWARADFAFGMGLIYLVASSFDWRSAILMALLTLPGCLPGQGKDQGDNTWFKALGLFCSGTLNLVSAPIAAWWALHHHSFDIHYLLATWSEGMGVLFLTAVSTGLGKAGAYRIAKFLPGDLVPYLFGQGFARGSTEWGELLFGAVEGNGILAVTQYLPALGL